MEPDIPCTHNQWIQYLKLWSESISRAVLGADSHADRQVWYLWGIKHALNGATHISYQLMATNSSYAPSGILVITFIISSKRDTKMAKRASRSLVFLEDIMTMLVVRYLMEHFFILKQITTKQLVFGVMYWGWVLGLWLMTCSRTQPCTC